MNSVLLLLTVLLFPQPAGPALSGRASQGRPPVPGYCRFFRNSARFEACDCKYYADFAAAQLAEESPNLIILIDGSASDDEREGTEARRAESAWSYFVFEKGIDRGRVFMRWQREKRVADGRSGGFVRILVLGPGDIVPPFVQPDLPAPRKAVRLAPN